MSTFAVTGASGYIASLLVKTLLEKGFNVHGTVRSLKDEKKVKYLHDLLESKDSKGYLKLFEADLLVEGSFKECFQGVDGVFHTASPFQLSVKDAQKDLVDPAVNGTANVLNEAIRVDTVRKVIVTSSMAAVCGNRQPGHVYTEIDWNDTATITSSPYPFSKTQAEMKAWELIKEAQGKGRNIELTTVNPAFVFGPVLSARDDSTSVNFIKSLCDGSVKELNLESKFGWIDIRDVIKAHISAMLDGNAKGRYLCTNSVSSGQFGIAQVIRDTYPEFKVTTATKGEKPVEGKYDNQKLKDLIGELVPIETCIKDTVESMRVVKLL